MGRQPRPPDLLMLSTDLPPQVCRLRTGGCE